MLPVLLHVSCNYVYAPCLQAIDRPTLRRTFNKWSRENSEGDDGCCGSQHTHTCHSEVPATKPCGKRTHTHAESGLHLFKSKMLQGRNVARERDKERESNSQQLFVPQCGARARIVSLAKRRSCSSTSRRSSCARLGSGFGPGKLQPAKDIFCVPGTLRTSENR